MINSLNNLFEWIIDLVPKISMIQPDQGGTRVTLGKYVKKLVPGWYFNWPVIHDITYVTTTSQVVDVRIQSCLTADFKDVCVGTAVKYSVSDAKKAILKVDDYDRNIRSLVLGVTARYVSENLFEELGDIESLEKTILADLRDEAKGWGLKINKVYITDIGLTKNYRILGSDHIIIGEDE